MNLFLSQPMTAYQASRHLRFGLLSVMALSSGCAKAAHSQDNPGAQSTSLTQIISQTQTCKDSGGSTGLCAPVHLRWQASDYASPADSPTVLHLEPGATDLLTLGKYRSRVKAILRQEEDGTFVSLPSYESQAAVASGFEQFFRSLSQVDRNQTSAYALRSVAPAFVHAFSAEDSALGQGLAGGHSLLTLGIIGEYAPEAALVVANMRDHLPEGILCAKDFPAIDAYVAKASSSLLSLTASLGVHVINLSGGDSYRSIDQLAKAVCPAQSFSADDIKHVLRSLEPFYNQLGTNAGAVVVQAGGSFEAGDSDPARNPIDCPAHNYPHRLRVGYLDIAQSAIGPGGEPVASYSEKIPSSLQLGKPCLDVYVNSQSQQGVAGERPLEVTVDGVVAQVMPFMYTSFAAPMVTARLIHLAQTSGSTDAQTLINSLTGSGRNQVQDPLKHRQFDVWRLNYRND